MDYKIIRSKNRNTIGIKVIKDEVKIRAPEGISEIKIRSIVNKKESWIREKLKDINNIELPSEKEFYSGEKFMYNGRRYRLKVIESEEEKLRLIKGKFLGHVKDIKDEEQRKQKLKQMFKKWYKKKANQKLPSRANYYVNKLDTNLDSISIRSMKNWGNFKNGKISLNWKLIKAPTSVQDYVIVHEIAHKEEDKHTDSFWNLVESIISNPKKKENWLKTNSLLLSNF